MKLPRPISRLPDGPACARCQAGAAAIEFAIVAPLLFLLLIAIVEVGLMLFTYSVLEGATNVGSRIGKTGFTNAGQSREDYIRNKIRDLSGGYLNPAQLRIAVLSYDNFNNVGQPEPCITAQCGSGSAGVDYVDVNCNAAWDADQGRTNAGTQGAVVLYRVTYPWMFYTPMFSHAFGNSALFNISAVATVKNENFGGGNGGC